MRRMALIIAMWVILIPAVTGALFGLWLYMSGGGGTKPVSPHPLPFSCQSMMQTLAPIDAGTQIAPLCGADAG